MNNDYEITVVLSAKPSESDIHAEIENISNIIQSNGGEELKKDVLGKKSFAYPIQKQNFGYYILFQIRTKDANFVSRVEREFKLRETVMRYLVVKKDKNAPELSEHARNPKKEMPEESASKTL